MEGGGRKRGRESEERRVRGRSEEGKEQKCTNHNTRFGVNTNACIVHWMKARACMAVGTAMQVYIHTH